MNSDMPDTKSFDTGLAHGCVDAEVAEQLHVVHENLTGMETSRNNAKATDVASTPPSCQCTYHCWRLRIDVVNMQNHCISLYMGQACAQYRPIEKDLTMQTGPGDQNWIHSQMPLLGYMQ